MRNKNLSGKLAPILFAAVFLVLMVGASLLDQYRIQYLRWDIWTEIIMLLLCGAALGLERFFWRPAGTGWGDMLIRLALCAAFIIAAWNIKTAVPYQLGVLAGGYELGMAVWTMVKRHGHESNGKKMKLLAYLIPIVSGLACLGVIVLFFVLYYRNGPTQRFLPIVPYIMLYTAVLALSAFVLSSERLTPRSGSVWGKAVCYFLPAALLFTVGCFSRTWNDRIPFILVAGYDLSISLWYLTNGLGKTGNIR